MDDAPSVTPDDRIVAADFLQALGFPQHASLVDGSGPFKDALGERAVAVIAQYRVRLLGDAAA